MSQTAGTFLQTSDEPDKMLPSTSIVCAFVQAGVALLH